MKSKTLMTVIIAASLTSGCLGSDEALFKDVSLRPPDAKPETIKALENDREFGEWVLYQDMQCDNHGCG